MLAINMEDVVKVLTTLRPYLISLGVALVIGIIVLIACKKVKETAKRKLIRSEVGIAMLLAVVIVVNLICYIPMSSMISLAMGSGTISEETSAEATALVSETAREGVVLLKNEEASLPLASDSNLRRLPLRFQQKTWLLMMNTRQKLTYWKPEIM